MKYNRLKDVGIRPGLSFVYFAEFLSGAEEEGFNYCTCGI